MEEAAAEHDRASRALAAVRGFQAARPTVLQTLGELAKSLPESTAIVSLRLDESGVSVVLLSTRGSALLSGLASPSGYGAPQSVGAMTRESFAGREMQRAALNFRPRELPTRDVTPSRPSP